MAIENIHYGADALVLTMTIEPFGACLDTQNAATRLRECSKLAYEFSRSAVCDGHLRHVCGLLSAMPARAMSAAVGIAQHDGTKLHPGGSVEEGHGFPKGHAGRVLSRAAEPYRSLFVQSVPQLKQAEQPLDGPRIQHIIGRGPRSSRLANARGDKVEFSSTMRVGVYCEGFRSPLQAWRCSSDKTEPIRAGVKLKKAKCLRAWSMNHSMASSDALRLRRSLPVACLRILK
jgi:hypothetical protein